MRFASLGSGSQGNATLIQAGETRVLLDCGFGLRDTENRLERLGTTASELDAVLVTHEHGDHIKGVAMLARHHGVPVYLTFGTRKAVSGSRHSLDELPCHEVRPERPFHIGALAIEPVPVPHDAREPCQYLFSSGAYRLGVLTDLGRITSHVASAYAECDALVLECNHDPDLLAQGDYPPVLKERVAGERGHLNNGQAASLLAHINQDRLQHLVLSHLSEKNNTVAHARTAMEQALAVGPERIRVADQHNGFDWLELAPGL